MSHQEAQLEWCRAHSANEIVGKYPHLAFMRNCGEGMIRTAAAEYIRSGAGASPAQAQAQAPSRRAEPTTAELLAEAKRLTAEVAELSASYKNPATARDAAKAAAEQDALDRQFGLGKYGPDAKSVCEVVGNVQRLGVKVAK